MIWLSDTTDTEANVVSGYQYVMLYVFMLKKYSCLSQTPDTIKNESFQWAELAACLVNRVQ